MENSVRPWSWARGAVSLPHSVDEETELDLALHTWLVRGLWRTGGVMSCDSWARSSCGYPGRACHPLSRRCLLSIAPSALFWALTWALTCSEKETEREKRREAILSNKFRGTASTLERPRYLVHGGICLLQGTFPIG